MEPHMQDAHVYILVYACLLAQYSTLCNMGAWLAGCVFLEHFTMVHICQLHIGIRTMYSSTIVLHSSANCVHSRCAHEYVALRSCLLRARAYRRAAYVRIPTRC